MKPKCCSVRGCIEDVMAEYNGQLFCTHHTERVIKKLEELNPGTTFVLATVKA